MAKIKITNATIVNGQHAAIGETFDVSAADAKKYFMAGKAVPVSEEPEKPATKTPAKSAAKAKG